MIFAFQETFFQFYIFLLHSFFFFQYRYFDLF